MDRFGRLITWTPHVSDGVKVVSIFNLGVDDSAEDVVEFRPRHRECKVLAAFGAPSRELECELRRYSKYRKRLPIALILEAQDADVEFDALLSIVHGENQMIELYSHYSRPFVSSK